MNTTVVYYDAVKKLLQETGYKVGYHTISNDITDEGVCDLWYRDISVIRVKHESGLIKYILHCNSSTRVSTFDSTMDTVISGLKSLITRGDAFPPSILNTFNNAIFSEYDDNPSKFSALMAELPKFDDEFKAIFQDEIDSMTTATTAVTEAPSLFQWYLSEDGKYNYIAGVSENTVLLKDIAGVSCNCKVLDLREVNNKYKMVDAPLFMYDLLHRVFDSFPKFFNPMQIAATLKRLGYTGTEEVYQLGNPFEFGKTQSSYAVRQEEIGRNVTAYFTDLQCNYVLSVCFGFATFMCLDTDRLYADRREETIIEDTLSVVRPAKYLDAVKEFVSNVITHFIAILHFGHEDQLLFFTKLLSALERIPRTKIDYDDTWEQFPEVEQLGGVTDTTALPDGSMQHMNFF